MDCFKTVSKNREDVQKYLKCYFDYEFPEDCSLTAEEIFGIMKNHLSQFSFSKYISDFILKKFSAEIVVDSSGIPEINTMISFCIEAFKRKGIVNRRNIFSKDKKIITNELLRKQVKNWFGGVTPARESIFLLAFALEMSCEELSEFLTNGIHDKGLNYKNPAEVAAFACLGKNKDYIYAEEILEAAMECAGLKKESSKLVFTSEYESLYEKIITEEKLIDFIAKLIAESNNPKFSVCIKTCYDELIEKIYENAAVDKMISVSNETGIEVNSSEKLSFGTVERYIYYYIPVKTDKGYYRTDTYAPYNNGNIAGKQNNLLKNSKWFFSTLLRRSDLKKMYESEKIISRDVILTLAFLVICEESPGYDTYEYIMEINDYLYFCRFEQINFSYPYDLFIFMCLQTDDPLSSFRKIWKYSWAR